MNVNEFLKTVMLLNVVNNVSLLHSSHSNINNSANLIWPDIAPRPLNSTRQRRNTAADKNSNSNNVNVNCTRVKNACSRSQGEVCHQHRCVNACAVKGYEKCECEDENDNFCYLCCGNTVSRCRPAHQYDIFQTNGHRWERESCRWCRLDSALQGSKCDDKQPENVCYDGKCVGGICKAKPEGKHCFENDPLPRICLENECIDPCATQGMRMCECPMPSIYRCQLCCYDYNSGECESAYYKHNIRHPSGRAIIRTGLSCGRFDYTCSQLGRCGAAKLLHWFTTLILCLYYSTLHSLHFIM